MGKRNSTHWSSKVGQRFGKIVLTKDLGVNKKKETIYLGKCDCGNEATIRSGALPRIASCGKGCIRRGPVPFSETRRKLFARISDYRKGATKRNLVFALSTEECEFLFSSSCYSCGLEPANGIDRINTADDYRTGNVAPCCAVCNTMKWDLSLEDFLNHIEKITKWQQQ